MSNKQICCLCGEDSSQQGVLKVNKIILEDPEDSNISYEMYVKNGQLYSSKMVTTVSETVLYNTTNPET